MSESTVNHSIDRLEKIRQIIEDKLQDNWSDAAKEQMAIELWKSEGC